MHAMIDSQENLSARIQADLHRLDTLRNRPDRFRLERTLATLFLVLFITLYAASPQAALAKLAELDDEDTLGSVIDTDGCFDNPNLLIEQLTAAGFSEKDIQSVLEDVCAETTSTPGDDKLAGRTGPAVIWEDPDHAPSQEQRRLSFTLRGEVDASQGLNLRMEPWTDGNRLTILPDHTLFEAVGRDPSGEWLLVLVDGAGSSDLGWIFRESTSLRDNPQVESLQEFDGQATLPAMITTQYEAGAALRLHPSQSSRELDRLPDGTRLMLRGRIEQLDGLWYAVEVVEPGHAGEIGFVKAHDGSESLVVQPGGNPVPGSRNNRLPELVGDTPQAAVEVQVTHTPTSTPTPGATFTPTATETPAATPIPTSTLTPAATPQEVAALPGNQMDLESIFEQAVQPRLNSEAAQEGTATLVLDNGQIRLYETGAFRELYPDGARNLLLEDPNTIRYSKNVILQIAVRQFGGQLPTLQEIEADPEGFLSLVGDREVTLGEESSSLGLPIGTITLRAIYEQPWIMVRIGRNPLGTNNGAVGEQKVVEGQLVLFDFNDDLKNPHHAPILAPDVSTPMWNDLLGVVTCLLYDMGLDNQLTKDQALYMLQGHLAAQTVSK